MYHCAPAARRSRFAPKMIVATAMTLIFAFASLASAEPAQDIVRVEEDWEMVVLTPDDDSSGPQITSVISPVGHLDSLHATFELNHQSLPEFVPGGIQLQTWEGEYPLLFSKFPNPDLMNTRNEVVTWTQSMKIAEGHLLFAISGGDSTTWGKFGGQGYLRISKATSLENLNGYNPAVSVENSGIPYASNRVKRLVLKRVRVTTADGNQHVDETNRVVHVLP